MNMHGAILNTQDFEQFPIKENPDKLQREQNYNAPVFEGKCLFQNNSNFGSDKSQKGLVEQSRRMHQAQNPVNTPYKPDWKPTQAFRKRQHSTIPSFEEEESGFHFTISKLNCNFSPVISKFSVCLISLTNVKTNQIDSARNNK